MSDQQLDIKQRIKEEFIKCATDPVYFMKRYYMIQHPVRGRMLFDLYPFQEKVMKLFQKHDYSIINKSRQLGISTLVSAYSLWLMLFNRDKNVLVIATKQETAKNMVTKVRFAYQNLPTWLKIGADEDNRLSLKLANGSQIKAVSAAGDSGRSEAVSLLIIDEAAFIDNIETIFTAAQQTLATGGGCVALSTPNGVGNWFHKTYIDSQEQKNKFLPISLPWTVHPERHQAWRDEQDLILGKRNAAQECDCNFSTSGNTVIDPEILTWYEQTMVCEPIERRGMDRALWMWEYPDPTKHYVITADVARGDGNDFSAFHVFDIENITQVAEFKAQIDTREYANVLLSVAAEYNQALLVVEHNNIGWDVVQTLVERGYNNIHYSYKNESSIDFNKYVDRMNTGVGLVPGFSMNERTRPLAVDKMRNFLENKLVNIKSLRLLEELRVFIWKNGKSQAMSSYNDDLVLSLAMAMYLRETSLKFKTTADNLTYAALNSFTRTVDNSPAYNANSRANQNPWAVSVNYGGAQQTEDITWLLG